MKKIMTRLAVSLRVSAEKRGDSAAIHNPFTRRGLTPGAEGVQRTGDVTGLGETEQESCSQKGTVTALECLKSANKAECHDLRTKPSARSNSI